MINLSEKTGLIEVLCDTEDQWILDKYSWSLVGRKRNYLLGTVDGKRVYLHRFLMGVTETKQQVDHRNGNFFDFRKENLRKCTNQQNMMNRGLWKKSATGFKGVLMISENLFSAGIRYNGKSIYLGRFDDAVSAAKAYNIKASELFGEFAWLNKI